MPEDITDITQTQKIGMPALLIWFILLVLFLEISLNVGNLAVGVSLKNLSLYFVIIYWVFTCLPAGIVIKYTSLNRYLFIAMILMAILILPAVYGENVEGRTLIGEIRNYKNYITPWLFFLIINTIVNDKITCKRIITGLVVFYFVTVFMVLLENYMGIDLGIKKEDLFNPELTGRSTAFSEVNQYAAFLVLFIPWYFSNALLHENILKKIVMWALLLLALLALALTMSKGAIIALFVSLVFLLTTLYRNRYFGLIRVIVMFYIILGVFLVSYLILPSESKEKLKERVTMEETYYVSSGERSLMDKATSGRTGVWEICLELFYEKPVFGYGYNAASSRFSIATHNVPLEWLVNYGIVGLLLFIIIYYNIYRHVAYHLKTSSDPESKIIYLGYLCGFIGFVTAMMGVNIYEIQNIFWIYTGVIYKYTELDSNIDQILKDDPNKTETTSVATMH